MIAVASAAWAVITFVFEHNDSRDKGKEQIEQIQKPLAGQLGQKDAQIAALINQTAALTKLLLEKNPSAGPGVQQALGPTVESLAKGAAEGDARSQQALDLLKANKTTEAAQLLRAFAEDKTARIEKDRKEEAVAYRNLGAIAGLANPWSTFSDYTSWASLTDRTRLARHLPPADVPKKPPETDVQELFRRPAGAPPRLSSKSTCLFPAFAQYLTDGFIRTVPGHPDQTTTNHEIDLCPLYGRTPEQTNVLRLKDGTPSRRGKLKSQMTGNVVEEYPPFLYPNHDNIADKQFAALDPPLLAREGQALPPQQQLDTIFAVGGDRVNTTPFSAMMNTLLLREHNRVAGQLETQNPNWDDERVFQTARNIMIPMYIKIVVEQYINHITLIPFSLRADPSVAWTANWNRPNWMTAEFSLLYRWHSLMPDSIDWPGGQISIAAFQVDNRPLLNVGLDAAFSAAAQQKAGELGAFNTAAALMDIEVRAVWQARFNRLDTYNHYRQAFGMKPATTFAEISSNPKVVGLLTKLYDVPDNVEFYPGLFAEDRVPDSPLPGLLLRMVAVDAFSQALTNPLLSEHVFNANTFTQWGLDLINSTSKLGDILARNVPARGPAPIEMTQASWDYVDGP